MAWIHDRPSGTVGTLCSWCHAQQLEALDEDAAIMRAEEEDDHIWAIRLSVGKCKACLAGSVFPKLRHHFYRDAVNDTPTLYFTVNELVNMLKGVTPAAVTTGNVASRNAGGHLATLRTVKIFHTLADVALLELMPFVSAALCTERSLMSGILGDCCGFAKTNTVLSRYKVDLAVERFDIGDGRVGTSKVDRFPVDATQEDADAVYDAVCDLVLDREVKLVRDPEASVEDDPLAVKFGATPFCPIFWASTYTNVQRAIDGRIRKVHVPVTITPAQKAELSDIVSKFIARFKSSPLARDIIYAILFIDMKSKKWTEARALQALMDLMQKYAPNYKFKGQIKLEPSKNGKPPRLIIADGDVGQVMAWCVFALIERYLYSSRGYKHRSIKGVAKKERIKAMAKELHFENLDADGRLHKLLVSILENDGSAWDACMGPLLREIIEEPLIDAASDMFRDFLTPESMYTEEHAAACKGETITLRLPLSKRTFTVKPGGVLQQLAETDGEEKVPLFTFYALKREVRITIKAIRRSGHRGTSVLNWFANQICWAWVLFGRAADVFAEPLKEKATDIFGNKVRVLWVFEGDDSLLCVSHVYTEEEVKKLSERWTALGHRPKLYHRRPGEAAEFCGWKILVDEYGLVEGSETVDVPRQFRNGHTCIAPEAVSAAMRGDRKAFAKVVVPGILCRAYNVAPTCPCLARYFLNMAEHFNGGRIEDADFSVRELIKMGEIMNDFPEMWRCFETDLRQLECLSVMDNMVSKVYSAVLNGVDDERFYSPSKEAEFAVAQGWVKETAEYVDFVGKLFSAGFSQDNLLEEGEVPGSFAGP